MTKIIKVQNKNFLDFARTQNLRYNQVYTTSCSAKIIIFFINNLPAPSDSWGERIEI